MNLGNIETGGKISVPPIWRRHILNASGERPASAAKARPPAPLLGHKPLGVGIRL